jgi:hypothetical protein
MLNALYKYLILNDNVSIPGVGSFHIKRSAAAFDQASGIFHPPACEIKFEQGTALTDTKFYHFLSGEKGITEVDAVRKFQDFAYQLRKDIQTHPFVELSNMGVLKRNGLGDVVFESSVSTKKYFPSIAPEEIGNEQEETVIAEQETTGEEAVVAKDRWWIWATVLALLALAAIGYYYMQDGLY